MECLRCNVDMFTAKFNANAIGTGVYLSNKKKVFWSLKKEVLFLVMFVRNVVT